ncbi:MAG: DUF1415 domain-containing protein [Gammaproteobacteria bacterium]
MQHEEIIKSVQHWLATVVVGLNLCPFAKQVLVNNRIRFSVTEAESEAMLLKALQTELEVLNRDETIDTTLLIHPRVLQDFYDYNQFLNTVDTLLVQLELEGIYQVASFHPDYQFAGTEADDVENYTNKSPYPMLHLIREESLEQVIENFPDPERISERNITLLKSLGRDNMRALLRSSFDIAKK